MIYGTTDSNALTTTPTQGELGLGGGVHDAPVVTNVLVNENSVDAGASTDSLLLEIEHLKAQIPSEMAQELLHKIGTPEFSKLDSPQAIQQKLVVFKENTAKIIREAETAKMFEGVGKGLSGFAGASAFSALLKGDFVMLSGGHDVGRENLSNLQAGFHNTTIPNLDKGFTMNHFERANS
jgi:hypothetical protein